MVENLDVWFILRLVLLRYCKSCQFEELSNFDRFLLINLINFGLTEEDTKVTYSYTLVYVFQLFLGALSDILLIFLLFHIIEEIRSSRILKIIHIIATIILGSLAIVSFAWYVKGIAQLLADGDPDISSLPSVDLTYAVLYLIFSSEILILSISKIEKVSHRLESKIGLTLLDTT